MNSILEKILEIGTDLVDIRTSIGEPTDRPLESVRGTLGMFTDRSEHKERETIACKLEDIESGGPGPAEYYPDVEWNQAPVVSISASFDKATETKLRKMKTLNLTGASLSENKDTGHYRVTLTANFQDGLLGTYIEPWGLKKEQMKHNQVIAGCEFTDITYYRMRKEDGQWVVDTTLSGPYDEVDVVEGDNTFCWAVGCHRSGSTAEVYTSYGYVIKDTDPYYTEHHYNAYIYEPTNPAMQCEYEIYGYAEGMPTDTAKTPYTTIEVTADKTTGNVGDDITFTLGTTFNDGKIATCVAPFHQEMHEALVAAGASYTTKTMYSTDGSTWMETTDGSVTLKILVGGENTYYFQTICDYGESTTSAYTSYGNVITNTEDNKGITWFEGGTYTGNIMTVKIQGIEVDAYYYGCMEDPDISDPNYPRNPNSILLSDLEKMTDKPAAINWFETHMYFFTPANVEVSKFNLNGSEDDVTPDPDVEEYRDGVNCSMGQYYHKLVTIEDKQYNRYWIYGAFKNMGDVKISYKQK